MGSGIGVVSQPRSINSKTPDMLRILHRLILGIERLGCPEFGKEKKPPPNGVSEFKNGTWHSFPGQVRALFLVVIFVLEVVAAQVCYSV